MKNITSLELEAENKLKDLDIELKKIKNKYYTTKKILSPVFFTTLLGFPLGIGYLLFKNKKDHKNPTKNYPMAIEEKRAPKKEHNLLTSFFGSEILTILVTQLITKFLKNKY